MTGIHVTKAAQISPNQNAAVIYVATKNSARCQRSLVEESLTGSQYACSAWPVHLESLVVHHHNFHHHKDRVVACLHRSTARRCSTAGLELLPGWHLRLKYLIYELLNRLKKRWRVLCVYLDDCRWREQHPKPQWFRSHRSVVDHWKDFPQEDRRTAHRSFCSFHQWVSC